MKETCPHNAVRKKRATTAFDGNFYVCGSCSTLFTIEEYKEPPKHKEPMFPKNPIPWGMRGRQA